MFSALGRFCVRRRFAIVVVYLVLVPIGIWLGGPVFRMLEAGGFEDPGAESWQVRWQLENEIGVGTPDLLVLYSNSNGNVDDVEMLGEILPAIERVEADPDVTRVVSYYTTGAAQLVSRDRTRTFLYITMRGDDQDKDRAFMRLQPLLASTTPGVTVAFAGLAPVNHELFHALESDLQRAELLAFPITALLLMFIFGSLVSSTLPLITGGLAIVFAFATLRGVLLVTDISIFAANIVSVLGLGLAVDYSLFLINRFREELPKRGVAGAVEHTVKTTGRAVAFSGVTVGASLLGLLVFPQMFLRSMAFGGIAIVVVAVVLALTLLPALLAILGHRVDAWRVPFSPQALRADEQATGFWHSVAFFVMKRPVLVSIAVVAPLLVLASPFLRFDPSMPNHSILPDNNPVRDTTDLLESAFGAHQNTPIDLVVEVKAGAPLDAENLARLAALSDQLQAVPGIRRVDGLFTLAPGVSRDAVLTLLQKPRGEQDPNVNAAIDAFTRGRFVRFALVSETGFNTEPTLAQVAALRALPDPAGLHLAVGGVPGILYDLKAVVYARAPLMVLLVAAVMFVVLFLVFGSITLPLKAIVMNFLSLSASYGAIVWIFQDGRLTTLLDYTPMGISDATAPLLMFAIVFGLSMDYEVLLLSRVREEYLRTGDNVLSVAYGLERTGRLITSAAALLIVVIGAFATSDILFMKALGVGMALAIALDATVIRALLVPAAMRMMGSWNWWAPEPLVRLWKKAGLSDLEGD